MNSYAKLAGELSCTVTSPQKENSGTKDAFVSYLVTTTTNIKSFNKSHFSVRRRFTDFKFLHKRLLREYGVCIIPPLPEEHRIKYVTGDRFSSDLITSRGHSLHRFVRRVSLHPNLRRASIFREFLESSDWNSVMESWTKDRTGSAIEGSVSDADQEPGVIDNLTDSLLGAFSKTMHVDQRFIDIDKKAEKLGADVATIHRVIAKMARREDEMGHDYAILAAQFHKLIGLEPNIADDLVLFADSAEKMKGELGRLRDHTDLDYHGSLKDMEAYAESIRALVREREKKQLDYEALTDYLSNATHDRDSSPSKAQSYPPNRAGGIAKLGAFLMNKVDQVRGADPKQSRDDRLLRLEQDIERLGREVDKAKQVSDVYDEQVIEENDMFDNIKLLEFRDTLEGFADAHIDFFDRSADLWQQLVDDLERRTDQPGLSSRPIRSLEQNGDEVEDDDEEGDDGSQPGGDGRYGYEDGASDDEASRNGQASLPGSARSSARRRKGGPLRAADLFDLGNPSTSSTTYPVGS